MRTYMGKHAGYDPLWAQSDDETILRVKRCKTDMKFDEIISGGVFKINDVFALQVSILENGADVETEAHLKVTLRCLGLSN